MSYPEAALNVLRDRGYRVTKPRRLVLSVLDAATVPLSPYEIADRIKESGERGDVVSIYRILQTFEANELAHRVLSSGKYRKCHLALETACDRHQKQHCHHNLICRQCGTIEEFHCAGMDLIEQVLAAQSRFAIEAHALEFRGVCANCQASEPA